MIYFKSPENIRKRVRAEFEDIQSDVKTYYHRDYDLAKTRELLTDLVPKLIAGRAEILLETLLDRLLDEAFAFLGAADSEVRSAFLDHQGTLKGLMRSVELDAEALTFKFDPQKIVVALAFGSAVGAPIGAAYYTQVAVSHFIRSVLLGAMAGTTAGVFALLIALRAFPSR